MLFIRMFGRIQSCPSNRRIINGLLLSTFILFFRRYCVLAGLRKPRPSRFHFRQSINRYFLSWLFNSVVHLVLSLHIQTLLLPSQTSPKMTQRFLFISYYRKLLHISFSDVLNWIIGSVVAVIILTVSSWLLFLKIENLSITRIVIEAIRAF